MTKEFKTCQKQHRNPVLQKVCLICGWLFPEVKGHQIGDYHVLEHQSILEKNLYLVQKQSQKYLMVESFEYFLPDYRQTIYQIINPLLKDLDSEIFDYFTESHSNFNLLYTVYPEHMWPEIENNLQQRLMKDGLFPDELIQRLYAYLVYVTEELRKLKVVNPGMILPMLFASSAKTPFYLLEWEYCVPLDDSYLYPRYYVGYHTASTLVDPNQARLSINEWYAHSSLFSLLSTICTGKLPMFWYPQPIHLFNYRHVFSPSMFNIFREFNQAFKLTALPKYCPEPYISTIEKGKLQQANLLFNHGYQAYLNEEWSVAQSHFEEAINFNTQDPHLYRFLALSCFKQDEFQDFLDHMFKAIRHFPLACLYYERAKACLEQQQLEDARRDLDKAVEVFPYYPEAFHLLGNIYQRLKYPKQAELAFKHALKLRNHSKIKQSLHSLYIEQNLDKEAELVASSNLSTANNFIKTELETTREDYVKPESRDIYCPSCQKLNPESFNTCQACQESLYKQPGAKIKHYQIKAILRNKDYENDRFHMVYLALDTQTKGFVVIKEYIYSPRPFKVFSQEIELVQQIQHEAFIPLINHFNENDFYYLVYKHEEGQTLQEVMMEKGPIDTQLGYVILTTIGLAILHLQSLKVPVIHGDVKPSNILITKQGQIKLLDFESARFLTDEKVYPSYTYPYAPPEQDIDHLINTTTDFYALGVTCIHMFTGIFPHLFVSYAKNGFYRWQRYLPHINAVVKEWVSATTKWDVEERPQITAQTFITFVQKLRTASIADIPTHNKKLSLAMMEISDSEDLSELDILTKQFLKIERSGLTYYFVSTEFYRLNHYDKAFFYVQEAMKIDSKYVQAFWLAAEIHIKRQKYALAIPILKHSLDYCNKAYQPYWLLGVCYSNTLQERMAIAAYKKAKKLYGVGATIDFELAALYTAAAQYTEAKNLCLKLLKNDTSIEWKAKIHHLLGTIYGKQEHFHSSIDNLKKSLEYHQEQPDIYYDLGLSYYQIGEKQNAREHFETCLKQIPEHDGAKFYMAILAIENKQSEQALQYLEQIEAGGENLGDVYFQKARAYTLQSRVVDALRAYEKALEYFNDVPQIYVNMANLYIAIDQPQAALLWLQKAAPLLPNSQVVAQSRVVANEMLMKQQSRNL